MQWYSRSNDQQASGFRRAMHRFVLVIRHPADLWLLLRISVWALVLPALKRMIPLQTLARWMWVAPGRSVEQHRDEKIGAAVRWISIFIYRDDTSCLERSLLLYRFLSASDKNPVLISGLKRTEDQGWKGHAWIMVDGKPFDESEASVKEFKTLMIYGNNGACSYPHTS